MSAEPLDLDDADAVIAADRDRLLFTLAYAGAAVRAALGHIESDGVRRLDAAGTRNLVIVVGAEVAGGAAAIRAISELLEGPPVTICDAIDRDHPWLGAADMVLVLTADGMEQQLTDSLAIASARGSEVLVVAPEGSAVQVGAGRLRARWIPPAGDEPGGAFWSALTLVAFLGGAPRDELDRLADDLDETAADCGPRSPRAVNAAKVMGEYAATGGGLAVGEDDVSLSAARLFAARALAWAGLPVAVADVRRDERGIERAIYRSRREGGDDQPRQPDASDAAQVGHQLGDQRVLAGRERGQGRCVAQIGVRSPVGHGLSLRASVPAGTSNARGAVGGRSREVHRTDQRTRPELPCDQKGSVVNCRSEDVWRSAEMFAATGTTGPRRVRPG